jgi:integrase/recombinase XerD
MKREAQPMLSEDGQHALDQYRQVLQHLEDLSPVTTRNYLSDLRQFIAWCECSWREIQADRFFTPQAVAPTLLIRYREYLQTTLGLKPSTVNRTLMSLKRYFAWTRKTQLIQSDPASLIKFVPKEASPPRHLSDEEEGRWSLPSMPLGHCGIKPSSHFCSIPAYALRNYVP